MSNKNFLFEIPFTTFDFKNLLFEVQKSIENKVTGRYISITNTESAYHALRIPAHLNYIQNADYSCCDGVGLVFAGKILGVDIPRLHGPDLMLKFCEFGSVPGWRHFFYGGKSGIPEILSGKLSDRFPGLITTGSFSPPFRELTKREDDYVVEKIKSAKPDVLWVGLGLLKQERWIATHLKKIAIPWMIGVGAAFDYHAGAIKRAPKIFRDFGLEWFYRVVFEPRMIRRNIYSALIFSHVVKTFFNRKKV